jgi:transcriptional regulator with XRE-family HTH domain
MGSRVKGAVPQTMAAAKYRNRSTRRLFILGPWVGPGRVVGWMRTPHPRAVPVIPRSRHSLEGYRNLPDSANFGARFGLLVRAKRGVEGLSQDALAGLSDLTKARISDLENGKTRNPHTKTVDALCLALNISWEARLACYAEAGDRLPLRLLENLALRFGDIKPQAREDDLEAFPNLPKLSRNAFVAE